MRRTNTAGTKRCSENQWMKVQSIKEGVLERKYIVREVLWERGHRGAVMIIMMTMMMMMMMYHDSNSSYEGYMD